MSPCIPLWYQRSPSWLDQASLDIRNQRVKIDNFSPDISLKYGVPQGGMLGPILFLIFINDISDVSSGPTTVFKRNDDDPKLCSIIMSVVDCISLQVGLGWYHVLQLSLRDHTCLIRLTMNSETYIIEYVVTVIQSRADDGARDDEWLDVSQGSRVEEQEQPHGGIRSSEGASSIYAIC